MKIPIGPMGLLMLAGLTLSVSNHAYAFDAADAFSKKCSACHTLGEDDIGPNLQGVTKRRDKNWIVKFVQESQTVVQSGDATAVELFNKFKKKIMPDQNLKEAEIMALMEYIEGGGGASSSPGSFKSAVNATPDDIAKGKAIFEGKTRLTNGGPSCLSCHSAGEAGLIGGGGLGPDLTSAFTLYGDNGLSKVISNISFPSMVEVFKDKPLTEDEVYLIKSFLYSTDKVGPVQLGTSKKFFLVGLVGFLLVLGFLDLSWKQRRKKTKRPIDE